MNIKLIISVLFCTLFTKSYAQIPGNQRGIYVNQFVDLNQNGTINTNFSILGNTSSENTLLQYCLENHFTYLTLYDLSKVFDGTGSTVELNKIQVKPTLHPHHQTDGNHQWLD